MKKYIFAFLATALFGFTSCENDEIEVEQVGSLTVSVNTATLYSDMSVTSSIQSYLGKNSNINIGVTVMLYNSEGKQVQKAMQASNTFNTMKFEFGNVADGEYTVVAVQTLVDKDEKNESDYWQLVDEAKLSTLRLDTKVDEILWYGMAGVGTQKVTVASSLGQVNVTPKSIGFIASFDYEKFSGSNLVRLGLYFSNVIDGVYLDPNASTKFYYENYNPSGTWTRRGQFYTSTGLADEGGMDLFIIETGSQKCCIGASNSTQYNDSKFTGYPNTSTTYNFEAGKWYEFFAIYNSSTKGLDTYIGLYSGFNTWYNNYTGGSTNPSGTTIYRTPYISWGGTVSAVKTYMSGYTAGNTIEYSSDLDAYLLGYYGNDQEEEIDYYFTSSTAGLFRSYVFAKPANITDTQIKALFASLGYTLGYQPEDKSYSIYVTSDQATYVQYGLNDDNDWYICYYDPTSPKNGASSSRSVNRTNGNGGFTDIQSLGKALRMSEAAMRK